MKLRRARNLPVLLLVLLGLRTTFYCQGFHDEGDTHGPIFITEPPSKVDFSNSTGTRIECVAHGNPSPSIRWTYADGSLVADVPSLRQTLRNGTLIFLPFRGEEYRPGVHAAVYKCSASNSVGSIVSRDINVRAVVSQYFEVQVYDEFVILGNTAVLKCHIPSFVRDYVIVTSWIKVEGTSIYSTVVQEGRFSQTAAGELYIENVNTGDGYVSFRCETLHLLTRETRLSTPGRIVVTDPKSSVSPRITHSFSIVNTEQSKTVQLPCASQAFPVPVYRWFQLKGKEMFPIEGSGRIRQVSSFLLIEYVQPSDSATYRCIVTNSVGEERAETILRVRVPLSVHVQPQQQTVDVGKPVTFTCSASGHPISEVSWFHNGKLVEASDRIKLLSQWVIEVSQVQKEDRGMYQCFVENTDECVQGTAELRLGDVLPTLVHTFSSKTIQPGSHLSLRCSAMGHPIPLITWTLDGVQLPGSRRFKTNEVQDGHGDVTGFLNITNVRVEDGGEFRCYATNKAGKIHYGARINVVGPPHIRQIPNASTIAGTDVLILCHVSGYPIESIKWERDGNILPVNRRQQVFENGTLIIRHIDRASDEGSYTCIARGSKGEAARRTMNVKVMAPPVIEPFTFPRMVHEGMRARLTCVVVQGDLPITMSWMKDGHHITPDLAVSIRHDDEFSSSLIFSSITTMQAGNYSCIAKNAVASTNYTTTLVVDVAPRWLHQPSDTAVGFRSSILIDCSAEGHPAPTITWKRGAGKEPGNFRDMNFTHSPHRIFRNGSLLLDAVQERDEGYYLCDASNGVGAGLSKVIYVTVHAAAHFDHKYVNRTIRRGENAHLRCRAKGDAPLTIVWMLERNRINPKNSPRFTISERETGDSIESELVIKHVDRKDSTSYTCHASNAFGEDEMHIMVYIEEPPDAPENVRILDHGSRTVNLTWNPPFDGKNPINRYIIQYKSTAADWHSQYPNKTVERTQHQLTISDLTPGAAYNFRVLAENSVGISPPSVSVGITTSEEAPSGAPLFVEAKALGPESVRVSWKPPRPELQNGDLLGYYIGYRIYDSSEPYVYETVAVNRRQQNELVLDNLRKFTKYSILVLAFNSIGSGPHSEELVVFTSEDVPSGPPLNVVCTGVDSSSILVTWDPPQVSLQNGVIQGYKVFYSAAKDYTGDTPPAIHYIVAPNNNHRTTLTALERFTNYSVTVLGFTRVGDGIHSEPRFCHTHEDVPGPPADIKALTMSADSILIAWVYPKKPNGLITKYNVYMRALEKGEQAKKMTLNANQHLWYEVRGLQENQRYEFWVTASTIIGEGESTTVVTQTPSSKVSARIASFSLRRIALWRSDVTLPCLSVGNPAPSREWRFSDKPLPRHERFHTVGNGSLLIRNVQRSDRGKYKCQVENMYGNDEVTQELIVLAPPLPPFVVVHQTTATSIELLLKRKSDGGSPILGYLVKYKRDFGGWEEMTLTGERELVTLSGLHCGTRYQIHVAAYNDVGVGEMSNTVTTHTKGTIPKVPEQETVLRINATTVAVRLVGWPDGGCPVRHFVVQYRPRNQRDFVLVSNNIPRQQEALVITDLRSGTTYHLHITVHNDAGSTVAEYQFITSNGNAAGNIQLDSSTYQVPFYKDMSIAIPILASTITLFLLIVAACFYIRRKKYSQYQHSVTSSTQNDYPDLKNRTITEDRTSDVMIGCDYDPHYDSSTLPKNQQFVQQKFNSSAYPEQFSVTTSLQNEFPDMKNRTIVKEPDVFIGSDYDPPYKPSPLRRNKLIRKTFKSSAYPEQFSVISSTENDYPNVRSRAILDDRYSDAVIGSNYDPSYSSPLRKSKPAFQQSYNISAYPDQC